ncbi:hypothetical protein Sjap_004892 [Stephania japonica]|uniref:Uncharacterized protein n=1 Tax=Stephania japonica TaxID=461633 RepID=A0AAP0K4E0_9MAGN
MQAGQSSEAVTEQGYTEVRDDRDQSDRQRQDRGRQDRRLEQQRGDEGQVGYATHLHLSSSNDINLSTSTRIGIRVVRTRNRKTRVRVKDPVIGILGCERRANVINADIEDIGGSFAKHRQPQSQSIVGGDDDKLQRSCDMEMFGMDNTSRRDRDMFRDVLTVELRGIYIGNAR